jgi:hypothetical protein
MKWQINLDLAEVNFPVTSYGDSEWGRNVGLPSLLWHSVQLGTQSCRLYVLAALYPQGNSLVLISVRGLSGYQGYWMRTEGSDHLKIFKDHTVNRTQDSPSCGAVPLPTVPPPAPPYRGGYLNFSPWFVKNILLEWEKVKLWNKWHFVENITEVILCVLNV